VEAERYAGTKKRRGAVIFDVDGVIFRGQFCFELSKRLGLGAWAAVVWDGFLFNMAKISLEHLLTRGYRRLRGLSTDAVEEVFHRMPRTNNAAETIARLKEKGYLILLISSGVPDELVKRLADELGADFGAGIHVEEENGRLTGSIRGILTHSDGKVAFVRKWLLAHGLSWAEAVAVGDDDSNLGLMARTGLSIGIHATLNVRRKADYLAERNNLVSIVPLILAERVPPPQPKPAVEIARRLVHATAFGIPFLARLSFPGALFILLTASLFYSVSEYLRLNGLVFPAFGNITRHTIREPERRRFAIAPLTLAAGVSASLLFPHPIPFVAVGVVAFGDTTAGLVGQFFGRTPLFYSPAKTLEGMFASFLACLAVTYAFLTPWHALAVSLFASFVESLPLKDWDNCVVPVSVAVACLAVC